MTVGVLKLFGEEEIAAAKGVLKEAREGIRNVLGGKKPVVRLKGLDTMTGDAAKVRTSRS